MARMRWRWAGIGILSLIGLGAEMMPDIRDWLASGIIWGVAFVWLIATIIYWRKHRKTVDKVKQPTLTEIKERVKARKQYLPQLKQLIGEYINRVEELARTDDRVLDLERYKNVYTTSKLFKRLSRGDENGALIGELYKQEVWRDNLIFREIEDEDNILTNISTNIDNLASNMKDTQVRNYVNGFRLGAHIAYSYIILNKLSRIHESGAPPMLLKFHYNRERKMLNAFRKHQNDINMRIDELLEGAEDG